MTAGNPHQSIPFVAGLMKTDGGQETTNGGLSQRLQRYLTYRRGVAELSACSDRTLKDLGIYRGDIQRLAWEATYGDGS